MRHIQTQLIYFILTVLLSTSFSLCQALNSEPSGNHQIWDLLLKKCVDENGRVDYVEIKKEEDQLDQYLNWLSNNPPQNTAPDNVKLAYWINAYNAFTVKLIIDHYPVESIKDIGSSIQIPFINSVWDIKFFEIGGEEFSLNNIEHKILRKKFEEPRIHFAIVCASISCPNLRNEAYTAVKLEKQLQEEAYEFINDPKKNLIAEDRIQISKIFSWFTRDFTQEQTLIQFLNRYSKINIDESAKVNYLDYNWLLNEQP